jgi:hypothetical protein
MIMSYIILSVQRTSSSRKCAILLILAVIGLVACKSGSEIPGPSVSTEIASSPSPTKQPVSEDWPYRWLQGIPCRPPCWEGITPGQTSAEEALTTLGNSPVIATASIADDPLIPDLGWVIWNWLDGSKGGEAMFDANDSSNFIYGIYPDLPAFFRLGDVIRAYGDPSHVIAGSYHGPDIGSGNLYDLSIVYLPQGFILYGGEGSRPVLSVDTHFRGVLFFVPDDKGLEVALGGADAYSTWITPWQGMKDFDFYCRDEAGEPCP